MSNRTIIPTNATGSQSPSGLHEFIDAYKKLLQSHSNDVNASQDMLQLGAKTAFIQEMEKWMTNPLEKMMDIHKSAEDTIRGSVEQLMRIFFKTAIEGKSIASAFEISKTNNVLSYGIILEEDTFEKREEVLKFLSLYYTFDLAEKIPVYFQFIPAELKGAFDNAVYIS